MNHCRKLELIPEDELVIENNNETKNETEVSSVQNHPLIDEPKPVEKSSDKQPVEKIDINLIKIVEDIVNRIIDRKLTVSKDDIKRKAPTTHLKPKSSNNPQNKKIKSSNWVFVRK
jgi:hypothetical protein